MKINMITYPRTVFNKTGTKEFRYYKTIYPVVSDAVSFTSNYAQQDALKIITQAENGNIKPLGQGFQSAFYLLNDSVGIKIPHPLCQNSFCADLIGDNNVKEFLGLKIVHDVQPDIAVNPIDLIEYNNKNYLITDFVKGAHPFVAKFNYDNLTTLINNLYQLDINGIVHSDLQNANIFIESNQKTKLIDFGSYSALLDNGTYVSSDDMLSEVYKNLLENNRKLSKEEKIIATFSANNIPVDLKNYSDNSFLKIKSNISNFEFRTVYEYIKQEKAENPISFLKNYLKIKAESYHLNMERFLKLYQNSLPNIKQFEQYQNAIMTESLFCDIFSNPSENVLKTELGKMQLKWLINDYQGNKAKAYSYYLSLLDSVNNLADSSSGNEKAYFEQMKKTLLPYQKLLDKTEFKGEIFSDNDNLVKRVFEKTVKSTEQKDTGLSKKLLIIFSFGAAILGLGSYIYKRYTNKVNVNIDKQNL